MVGGQLCKAACVVMHLVVQLAVAGWVVLQLLPHMAVQAAEQSTIDVEPGRFVGF